MTSAPWPEHVAQRLALQQFADDVRRAFVRADVVDGEDVGMIQRRRGAGFLLEAAKAVGIRRIRGGQDLDRDLASETRVVGEINLAHSATAQQVQDFVGAEQRAGGQGHREKQCADYTSMT